MPSGILIDARAVEMHPRQIVLGVRIAERRRGELEHLERALRIRAELAIFVGIGVALVLFATFFPETLARAGRRFRRQLSVQLSRFAAARHPPLQAFQFALCEQLATTLARVKDEPALARECLTSGVIALSTARAIDGQKIALGADQLAPGIAAEVSSLLGHISWAYSIPPGRASSKARGRRAPFVAARSPRRAP